MDDTALLHRITSRPDVFGGKPIIRDMRISVELILVLRCRPNDPRRCKIRGMGALANPPALAVPFQACPMERRNGTPQRPRKTSKREKGRPARCSIFGIVAGYLAETVVTEHATATRKQRHWARNATTGIARSRCVRRRLAGGLSRA
jgi:hypothetical protein